MKKYRVAMLGLELAERLECHSWHYAPYMADCDALVMRDLYPGIYYWLTDYGHPDTLSKVERVEGFEITKTWDIQGVERDKLLNRFIRSRPKICNRVEETWEDVDAAFIADGGGDGSLHLKMVAPFLQRGIPVFVDKPFACEYKDAKAMVELAIETGTPLMSCSILSHVNEVQYFRSRWQEIQQPGIAVVKGVGPSLGAVIHTLALAQGIFGTGVDWVECMGTPPPDAVSLRAENLVRHTPFAPGGLPLEIMMLHYPDSRQVLALNTAYDRHDWFSCEVWSRTPRRNPPPRMYLRSHDIGDPEFLSGTHNIVKLFKQMLDTGKPPIPYETPLELIAIVEAGRKAQLTRQRVYLKEIDAKSFS